MQDELILLNRARALDPEALAQIHDVYYTSIFRYMAFRVSDHHTAEDLTSEVFTRLLSALRDNNAPQNTIRGWLFGAASMVLKEHYRKQKRAQFTELDESLASGLTTPDQTVEKKLFREQVKDALGGLTEDQQQVLALRYGYEMSIREVAETLGKTEGSVKQLRARALAALSKVLSGEGAF
ncbi:MAG: sigma-70 family RNA polymerase sigma factor [Ardenticatenaceae bacterium]|nr:sigma-70 family RNA polymerase sigma factor [Ardenticatenaceae bacterium]